MNKSKYEPKADICKRVQIEPNLLGHLPGRTAGVEGAREQIETVRERPEKRPEFGF